MAKLGQSNISHLGSFKNKIINGNMDIAQRGTTITSPTNAYTLDRWKYTKSGAMVHTIYQSADAPTVDECGVYLENNLLIDCTTVDSSIAAGDYTILVQRMEGYLIRQLMGKTITLSFWVKATKTGTYCVAIRNSNADRSYIAEYTVNTTVTWEKKVITLDMHDGSSGTWDFDTGIGIQLVFTLACGSTYQTTADTWASGNYLATSNQVNGCDSTDNNFKLTAVQLEVGSSATDLEVRSIEQELAMCQRYYIYDADSITEIAGAHYTSGYVATSYINFMCEMRQAPTITLTNVADVGFTNSLTLYNARSRRIGFHPIFSSSNTGEEVGKVQFNWTADAEL